MHEYIFFLFSGEGSSTFLNFVRGDLILLDDDTSGIDFTKKRIKKIYIRKKLHWIFYVKIIFSGEAVLTSGWCTGTCERTEDRGDFPAEAVYVLPCLSRPPDDILVRQLECNPFFTSIIFFIFLRMRFQI